MEQQNNNPAVQNQKIAKEDSILLYQVRQNFGIFAGISLIFALAFTSLFYKASIGFNTLLFTVVIVILLWAVMEKLELPVKKVTAVYYLGALLLGLSTMLSANGSIQFLNIIGMLMLLDLSLIHQFNEAIEWNFLNHLKKMFGLFFYCLGSLAMPFADFNKFLGKTRLMKNNILRNILWGLLISVPILAIIVTLLSSADLLFADMTQKLQNMIVSSDAIVVCLMTLLGFLACYSIICGAAGSADFSRETTGIKQAEPTFAITVMSLLTAVYLFFCVIQVVYLFSGGLFILPGQYTFAEYARRGFFELVAVTVINLGFLLISNLFFRKSKILQIVLLVMSLCTYIMIASAAYRMSMYISAYHLTFLRLLVLLFLLMDSFVLAGLVISLFHQKFPLFGYCVAVVSVCYITFSFLRPDYLIASYYVAHKNEMTAEDLVFLTTELSYDAAPVVLPLLTDMKSGEMITDTNVAFTEDMGYGYVSGDQLKDRIIYYDTNLEQVAGSMGIRGFNLSYDIALRYQKKYPMTK